MSKTNRTDAHRPSTIIPANYEQWNTYSLASMEGGFPMPAIGIDCAAPYDVRDEDGKVIRRVTPVCPDTGRCCVESTHRHAKRDGRAIFGWAGRCGVCGAHFKHGSMFRHESGEIVHMGYDCAAKYEIMYDRSAAELERDRVLAATAKQITREQKAEARAEFLAANPGLADALDMAKKSATECGIAADDDRNLRAHAILVDMRERFIRWAELSEKAVAFAIKLATQITTPVAARPVEIKADAPTGKGITFTGEIVSVKLHVSEMYGASWKCTVKVTNDDGSVWLAWGSMPSAMLDTHTAHLSYDRNRESAIKDLFRGLPVEVKATLEASQARTCHVCDGAGAHDDDGPMNGGQYQCKTCKGKGTTGGDKSFAFMKRPTMTVAGLYSHPVYKAPKKSKCKECKREHGVSNLDYTKRDANGLPQWTVCLPDGRCKVVREDLDYYGCPIEGKARPF